MSRITTYLVIGCGHYLTPYNLEEDFIADRWDPPRVDDESETWCRTLVEEVRVWRV